MVGRQLLAQLRASPKYEIVHCTRRALDEPDAHQVDFTAPNVELGGCDVGFCALGTTIKQAGSKQAFERVDFDAVVQFAKWCKDAGARSFVLVTSLGADPNSSVFYNKVKGRVQEAVRALGFARLVVLQPSVLDGERTESRPGEAFALAILRGVVPVMGGPLRRYRPSRAIDVARAMVHLAEGPEESLRIVPAEEIPALSAQP